MKTFMPDVSAKDRTILMQENASKVEDTTYQKTLTADELTARREDLVDNAININIMEDELKVIKDDFKIKMDPLKSENKRLLSEIKTKQATVTGIIYHIPNHDTGYLETFDHEGELLSTRKLRPEERQGNVFSMRSAMSN